MENYKGKKSKWEGLWRHSNCWTSSSFNLTKLKNYKGNFQIVITRNKAAGYDEDDDYNEPEYHKPEFLFAINGTENDSGRELEIEDDPAEKIQRLSEILRNANYCPMMLPSESQERAASLYEEAVSIIEDLTGAKWYFERLTY